MQVLHLISGLNSGGAEGILYKLIKYDKYNTHHIIAFSGGFYLKEFKKIKANVALIKINKYLFFLELPRLIKLIKKKNPDLIQSWMYHADFITIFLKFFFNNKNFYWNIRNTAPNIKWSNFTTIVLSKICAFFSNIIPTKIISCSTEAAKQHIKLGYSKNKMKIVFNGFDNKKFKKNLSIRKKWRKKLRINQKCFLIGCFARYHAQKDHKTLLISFNSILKKKKNIKLILVGDNIRNILSEPQYKINKKKILILKPTNKINEMYNTIDLFVLPSVGYEGFPNVLAESMLCEKYCLATDIGDSRTILNRFGKIFKTGDSYDLTKKILAIFNKKYLLSNKKGRSHIVKNFKIEKMIKNYNLVWSSK